MVPRGMWCSQVCCERNWRVSNAQGAMVWPGVPWGHGGESWWHVRGTLDDQKCHQDTVPRCGQSCHQDMVEGLVMPRVICSAMRSRWQAGTAQGNVSDWGRCGAEGGRGGVQRNPAGL